MAWQTYRLRLFDAREHCVCDVLLRGEERHEGRVLGHQDDARLDAVYAAHRGQQLRAEWRRA